MTASSSIKCTIKKPVEVKISDTKSSLCSGLSIVDVSFPNNSEKGIHQLENVSFKNSYTAFVTVKVKSSEHNGKWKTCLHRYQLMKSAHCETGSQDYFTLSSSQMFFVPHDVTAVRLVLQQPSSLWNQFGIEQVSIGTPSQTVTKTGQESSISKWLEQHLNPKSTARTKAENVEVDSISEGLHRLWALTETVKAQQTSSSLGRYDVDDSYEINLLSYT